MRNIVRNIEIGREQLGNTLVKFFPNIAEVPYACLQLLEVKAEFEGLLTELETNFNVLQVFMRKNQQQFVDVVGFAMNAEQEEPTVTLLRESATLSLQEVLADVQKKSGEWEQLLIAAYRHALAIVERYEVQLQEVEPRSLQIYFRKNQKGEYRPVIGFCEEKLYLSMKKSYEKGEYSRLFAAWTTTRFREYKFAKISNQLEKQELSDGLSSPDLEEIVKRCSQQRKNSRLKTESDLFEMLESFSFIQTRGLLTLTKAHLYSNMRIYNKVVQDKQTMLNKGFDWQLLSFDDVTTGQPTDGPLYNNPLCSHFDSFSKESIQRTYDKCRKCEKQIVADPTKLYLYQNKFLQLLKHNCMNPKHQKVMYSFQNHFFFVGKPFNFYNYCHFAQYIRMTRTVLDRPDAPLLLENEKAYLSIRLLQKSDYVTIKDIVKTPVRGLFCKHISFFDLCRIYPQFVKGGCNPNNLFECPICDTEMPFTEIVYLPEVVELIEYLIRRDLIGTEKSLTYLTLCHPKKELKLVTNRQKGQDSTPLPFYANLLDPRIKFADKEEDQLYHQKVIEEYNRNRVQAEPAESAP